MTEYETAALALLAEIRDLLKPQISIKEAAARPMRSEPRPDPRRQRTPGPASD